MLFTVNDNYSLIIDLSDPPVFVGVSPNRDTIRYSILDVSDSLVVSYTFYSNPLDNDNLSLLKLKSRGVGTGSYILEASLDCLVNSTRFKVTVNENNNND